MDKRYARVMEEIREITEKGGGQWTYGRMLEGLTSYREKQRVEQGMVLARDHPTISTMLAALGGTDGVRRARRSLDGLTGGRV